MIVLRRPRHQYYVRDTLHVGFDMNRNYFVSRGADRRISVSTSVAAKSRHPNPVVVTTSPHRAKILDVDN